MDESSKSNNSLPDKPSKAASSLPDEPDNSNLSETSSSPINLLANELLILIFSKFDISDLLKFRLVNKKWNFIIENYIRIKGLTADNQDGFYSNRYYFNFQPVDQDYFFSTFNLVFLEAKIMKRVLSKLKRLNIEFNFYGSSRSISKFLVCLNFFHELEELQLILNNFHLHSRTELKLSNLKNLRIEYDSFKRFKLNMPKLTKFRTNSSLKSFEFIFPYQITHLFLSKYEKSVPKFKNLKFFYCKDADALPVKLLTFLSLEELHCHTILKELVLNLINDKIGLETNFKLFYRGFQIKNRKDFNQYLQSVDNYLIELDSNTPIIASNYLKSSNYLPWIREVNYNYLVEYFKDRIEPMKFLKKLIGIKKIEIKQTVEDSREFTKFIKNCKKLEILDLERTSLPKLFYDQLPFLVPFLKELTIIQENLILGSKFVENFKWLDPFNYTFKYN